MRKIQERLNEDMNAGVYNINAFNQAADSLADDWTPKGKICASGCAGSHRS